MLISELLMFITSMLLGMCPLVDLNLSTVLQVTRLPVVQTVAYLGLRVSVMFVRQLELVY